MAYIRTYNRAGSGLDMSGTEDGMFFVDVEPSEARLIDQSWYDIDTYILTFRDRTSELAYEFSIFVRDEFSGSVIESIYYFDDDSRSILDMYGLDIFVSNADLASGSSEWFFDLLNAEDTIIGNDFSDTIKGGDAGDFLQGKGKNDRLHGERGDDFLDGGSGKDRLFGGSGDDQLHGGSGSDLLRSGTGIDVFVFERSSDAGRGRLKDVVQDFDLVRDYIDLSEIDANEGRRGNQTFDFIGGNSFSALAGELRFRNNILSGDTDGDGQRDFQIEVSGVDNLREIDFYL